MKEEKDPLKKANPESNPKGDMVGGPPPQAAWLWVFLAMTMTLYFLGQTMPVERRISYSAFKDYVEKGLVEKVILKGKSLSGSFKNEEEIQINQQKVKTLHFLTVIPSVEDPTFIATLEKKAVEINVIEDKDSWVLVLMVNLLPWVIIIAVFYYASKKFSKGMGGPFGGKDSPFFNMAKSYERGEHPVTFKDVAGSENSKKDLQDIVDFLKSPQRFNAIGAYLPKGVLLIGSPGTGKTLLAKACAGEAGVPFFSINGSEFIEIFVGVGASRVREVFSTAKKNAPAIIFIDEIDAIGRVRGTGLGGGHDEREQTLNQILAEMDGFQSTEQVIVMAATNRPDILDPALIRPGRFDRQVTMELPHQEAREEILKVHLQKVKLKNNPDLKKLAKSIIGFSGADIQNLVNEAALLAARSNENEVDEKYFGLARDKIIMGNQREEKFTPEDKKIIAYHEAGHAVVAYYMPQSDPINKITIIPRGRALGFTEQQPEKDRFNPSRKYLESQIAILLGGRMAEEVVFNDVTVGSESDLKRATKLARKMVVNYGMSEKIGPLAFEVGEVHPFLGKEISKEKDYSEGTAELIDQEVKKLILTKKDRVMEILTTHKRSLVMLADALLEKETLEKEDIYRVLESSNGFDDSLKQAA